MLEVKTSSTSHHLTLMKTVMEIRVAIILQSQIYYFQVIAKTQNFWIFQAFRKYFHPSDVSEKNRNTKRQNEILFGTKGYILVMLYNQLHLCKI